MWGFQGGTPSIFCQPRPSGASLDMRLTCGKGLGAQRLSVLGFLVRVWGHRRMFRAPAPKRLYWTESEDLRARLGVEAAQQIFAPCKLGTLQTQYAQALMLECLQSLLPCKPAVHCWSRLLAEWPNSAVPYPSSSPGTHTILYLPFYVLEIKSK